MKVLKGFVSVLLAGIMLVCLIAVTGILMFRTFLSGPTLGNIARSMIEANGDFEVGELFDGMKFDSDEIDDIMDEMSEYISKDELYDEVGELSSQMLRYAAGNIDHIDGSRLKAVLKKAAKQYEKKTGEDIDIDELEEGIDKAIKEMEKEARDSDTPAEVTSMFNALYSNGILIGCAVVFVVCAILIVVMFKSVTPLLIHLSILGFLHGITNGVLGLMMASLLTASGNDETMKFVIDPLKGIFLTTAFICIAVAVISIILIIIVGVTKKKQPVQPVYYQAQ